MVAQEVVDDVGQCGLRCLQGLAVAAEIVGRQGVHIFPCGHVTLVDEFLHGSIGRHVDGVVVVVEHVDVALTGHGVILSERTCGEERRTTEQRGEHAEVVVVVEDAERAALAGEGHCVLHDVCLTVTGGTLVVDLRHHHMGTGLLLEGTVDGHLTNLAGVAHDDGRTTLCLIIGVAVLHIAHNDEVVDKVLQTVLHLVCVGHRVFRRLVDDSCRQVIVVAVGHHGLTLVVVGETIELGAVRSV